MMISTMGPDVNRAISLDADAIEVATNEERKNEEREI